MKRFVSSAIAVFLFFGVCNANPTDKSPDKPLATHGTIDAAKGKAAELYSMYAEHEKLAIRSHEVMNDRSKLPYKELGKANGILWQAKRDVEDLVLMGEPAGIDLRSKISLLRQKIGSFALTSASSSPRAVKYVRSIVDKLKKETPKRTRDLAKLADNIQKGQLDVADATAKRMGTDLYSRVAYLSPTARKPYISKFKELLGRLDDALASKRRKAYQQQAREKLAANSKLINGLAAEISRVTTELSNNGTVKIDDQDANHAAAIIHLCDQWGVASSAMMRNLTLQWIFTRSESSKEYDAAAQQAKTVATAARGAIVDVVKLATNFTPEDQVEATYSEILQSLSYVDRRVSGRKVSDDCEAVLSALVAKSPAFRTKVEAYRQATADSLKWRETFAQLQAESLSKNYPASSQVLSGTTEVSQTNKPEVFGRFAPRKLRIAPKSFSSPANWTVFQSGSVLNSRRVSELDPLRLYSGSKTAVGTYSDLHYSNVRVELPIKNQLRDLRRSLFLKDDQLPLTIESASAISSANWQDFVKIGGVISEVHMEAFATRFATLPGVAYSIFPLGTMPSRDTSIPVVQQSCWRLNIEPHWARHRYFVVTIPQRVQIAQ